MINPAQKMNNIPSALFRTTLIEEKKSSVIKTLKDDSDLHQLHLAIRSWNCLQTSTFPVSSCILTESPDQRLSFEPRVRVPVATGPGFKGFRGLRGFAG